MPRAPRKPPTYTPTPRLLAYSPIVQQAALAIVQKDRLAFNRAWKTCTEKERDDLRWLIRVGNAFGPLFERGSSKPVPE
jgi:hypothetical protein